MSTNNTCANCGKGEENSGYLKACTACNMVKYCNRECQIAHRSQHKKLCKKRAAELYDEKLFKEPPPPEECPICMLPLPTLYANCTTGMTGMSFHSCCGKSICDGCIHAMSETGGKNGELCAYCRTLYVTNEEEVERVKKLMEKGNAKAFHQLAGYYAGGINGLPQDLAKANELCLRAGELGYADGYYNLGISYANGMGVDIDKKKAEHYYELAAINGNVHARHNLGCIEGQTGNYERAMKHFQTAARAGYQPSLDLVKEGYMRGHITKEEYANTLREYQTSQDEMKSKARDKAAVYFNAMDNAGNYQI